MAVAGVAAAPEPPASLRRRLAELDEAWSLYVYDAFGGVPRSILKALEVSGDGWLWLPLPIALLLSFRSSPLLFPLLLALVAGNFIDLLFVGFIKHRVRRNRPIYNKGMRVSFAADQWSFPSGHSSRVFFIATFLQLAAGPLREAATAAAGTSDLWPRWTEAMGFGRLKAGELLPALVLLWSTATSLSRVLLGRHFVLDVAAGVCVGVLEGLVVFIFYSWMR